MTNMSMESLLGWTWLLATNICTKNNITPAHIIAGMEGLENSWAVLIDALGIGRPPDPMIIAAVFIALLLSLLAGTAIGRFVLWLPDAILWLLSSLFEILYNLPSYLFGGARENNEPEPKENEGHVKMWLPRTESIDEMRERKKQKEAEADDDYEEESDWEEDEGEEIPKKQHRELDRNFYLERELAQKERDELLERGYVRLKTSPFGDSGASYYLVNKRWNEGAEHAFFCYLIESLLKKKGKEVDMHVNDGPDVVFKHKKKDYCIDVETGTNLVRDKEKVARKFEQYSQQYYRSYIFVTKKKFKHKYRKFGIVITRASLRKALLGIQG